MNFQQINSVMIPGVDLCITIRKQGDKLVVTTIPRRCDKSVEDMGRIIPLVVTGRPAELDSGFIDLICQPMSRASAVVSNTSEFEAQLEAAMSGGTAGKSSQEAYRAELKLADECQKAQHFQEALDHLNKARALGVNQPGQKNLDVRIAGLKAQISQGSLFDMQPAQPVPEQKPVERAVPVPDVPTQGITPDASFEISSGEDIGRDDEYADYLDFNQTTMNLAL